MTGINHITTGVAVALAVKQPAIVYPVALASHFLLDALPHFGFQTWEERRSHKSLFNTVISVDTVLIFGFIALLVTSGAPFSLFLAGLVAFLPDLVWVYKFVVFEQMGAKRPAANRNALNDFHAKIQVRESRNGIFVELLWFAAVTCILVQLWP